MQGKRAEFVRLLSCAVLLVSLAGPATPQILNARYAVAGGLQQSGQADSALNEGRRLLRRGQADQALGYLQTALNLYTSAKNARGAAAAEKELGDLYLRQGQYQTALDHYQRAYEAFAGASAEDQKNEAAASSAASRVGGGQAGAVTGGAGSGGGRGGDAGLVVGGNCEANY